MADTQTMGAHTEVPAEAGGLPQLNVIADGTYTNQIFWLAITFAALFIIVSRMVLPKITRVIEDRDEQIRTDLDKAAQDRKDTEAIAAKIDAVIGEARSEAQGIVASAKSQIQADVSAATAKLDAELEARVSAAEADILKSRDAALEGVESVASDVARDIVERLTGVAADEADLSKAVKSALDTAKEAR